jgi:hypothetical protein
VAESKYHEGRVRLRNGYLPGIRGSITLDGEVIDLVLSSFLAPFFQSQLLTAT